MNYKLLILSCLTLSNVLLGYTQVTIGDVEKPVGGAILQLKNISGITDGTANSTKGMMLPRVKLTTISSLSDIHQGTGNEESLTGLWIYNTNIFCENDKINDYGMYVWNGKQWTSLNEMNNFDQSSSNVWVTKDRENNSFRAARFGNQIWMVDNLAVKSYDSESGVTVTLPTTPNGITLQYDNISLGYPAPNPTPNPIPTGSTGALNGSDTYYYDNFKEYGILYTWMAATGSKNSKYYKGMVNYTPIDQQSTSLSTIGNNEVEKIEPKGYIQGICPNGWHLPSDREWNMLTKEIFENPQNYSYITKEEQEAWITNTWDDALSFIPLDKDALNIYENTGVNSTTSNLALAMKRPCDIAYSPSVKLRNGRGFLAANGGFNMIPAGSIYSSVTSYGNMAKYWSSSLSYNSTLPALQKGISRATYFQESSGINENSILKGKSNTFDYCSVRCVYHGDKKEDMPNSWSDLF